MTDAVVLAEVGREVDGVEVVESCHRGHVAVVGPDDRVHGLGDPHVVVFPRSAVKPLQATACLEVLGAAADDVPDDELAVAWASHRGEPRHLAAVRRLLARAEVAEDALTCPPGWPEAATRWPPVDPDVPPTRLRFNCSGKHALFALAGRVLGLSGADLVDPDRPLQQRVLALLGEELGGLHGVGVDGCGAPAVRARLDGLARATARVAGAERFARVRAAGFAHPGLVGGEGRLDSALLAAGVVAKVGAEGSHVAGWLDADGGAWGLAATVEDGAERGVAAATVGLLVAAGVVPEDTWAPAPVTGGGRPVGRVRATDAVVALGGRLAELGAARG